MKAKKKEPKKKTKYWLITILILILGIITFSVVYYYAATKKYEQKIINADITQFGTTSPNIVYGTTLSYDELLDNVKGNKELSKDAVITLKVNDRIVKKGGQYEFVDIGENKLIVEIKYPKFYFAAKKDFDFKYLFSVTETAEPYIANVQDFEIGLGETLDLTNYFLAYDVDGSKLTTEVYGTFDNQNLGSYDMYVAALKNGEVIVRRDFKVIVKNPEEITTTIPEGVTPPSVTEKPSEDEEVVTTTTTVKTTKTTKKPTTTKKTTTKKTTTKKTTTKFNCATSKSKLKDRGYKPDYDKDACEKDQKASEVVKQIANEIKSKGYKTDLEKVQAAASKVSEYYYKGVHVESGYDYRTPYGVFVKGEASCAGCTRALIQVLEYLGFKCEHANANARTHQWVILTMDGQKGYADGQVGWVGYGCHPIDDSCQ